MNYFAANFKGFITKQVIFVGFAINLLKKPMKETHSIYLIILRSFGAIRESNQQASDFSSRDSIECEINHHSTDSMPYP